MAVAQFLKICRNLKIIVSVANEKKLKYLQPVKIHNLSMIFYYFSNFMIFPCLENINFSTFSRVCGDAA